MAYTKKIFRPSPKAIQFYKEAQKYPVALAHGAVRSSKSHTLNVLAFHELKQLPPCAVLLSGKSSGSVARNIIAEWKVQIGANKFKQVYEGDDRYYTINVDGLRNKRFYVVGAGKAKDEEKIQGATFGYWLGDEIVLHTKEFVMMALSRLSLPFSIARWSCNPDMPTNYIKTEFIDNEELVKEGKFYHLGFALDDNPSLTTAYKERTKSFYSGSFYKRMILGQWCAAEGAIYNMFDIDTHVIDMDEPIDWSRFDRLSVAVDYGYQNATCYLLTARERLTGCLYIIDEFYWNGRKTKESMTDYKLAQHMQEFIRRNLPLADLNGFEIIVDPSASSFKEQLRSPEFKFNVRNAKNDVLDGIHDVQVKFARNLIKINRRCINLINELQSYVWNEEASLLKGCDVPLKENDHACFAGDTLVVVNDKVMRLDEIPEMGVIRGYDGQNVSYRNGGLTGIKKTCKVSLSSGEYINCTLDHKFLTLNGWIEAQYLKGETLCISTAENIQRKTMDIGTERLVKTKLMNVGKKECHFIERFGGFIMEKFQKVFIFITKMATKIITKSIILKCSHRSSIYQDILGRILRTTKRKFLSILEMLGISRKNGIRAKKGLNGTENITKRIAGRCMRECRGFVLSAARILLARLTTRMSIAPTIASQRREEIAELIISKNNAHIVAGNSSLINTQNKPIVVENVEISTGELEKTYCLTVDRDGCFSLANGIIVSNCDCLRYQCFTLFPEKKENYLR